MYVQRVIEKPIREAIVHSTSPYNVILLSGARQCGKSTLVSHLFPPSEHIHINLARDGAFTESIDATGNFDDFTFLIESYYHYKIGSGKVLVIDEAQLSKKLGGYVRFMKEEWARQHVILTGSTLSTLFDHTQKPTGRVVEFTLRPFNFIEFLTALNEKALIEKLNSWTVEQPFSERIHREFLKRVELYLKIGGLPEIVLAYKAGQDYLRLLANIFAFYKRDFESKLTTENLGSIFNQAFLRIAASTGSPIKLSSIIQSSSPGYRHVKSVLAILESWHQIIRIECETSRLSEIGSVTPKRYIFDHGIRFIQNPARFNDLQLTDGQTMLREDVGGLIENMALTEYLSLGYPVAPRSWCKTHQSGHIDFIGMNQKGETVAIEVKSATRFNQKHVSGLLAFHEFFPSSQLVLLNCGPGGRHSIHGKEIVNLPIYAIYQYFKK